MENKKIGVITFHNAINYGAVLQTYSLSNYIKNKLNIECEVIDYECEKFKKNYKSFRTYKKNFKGYLTALLKMPYIYIKNKKFKKFIYNNINKSSVKYTKETIKNANNIYNYFITGSDQVWNIELTDDSTYFLDFVSNKNIKLSYAASCGKEKMSDKSIKDNVKYLKSFKKITVREEEFANNLKKLINKDIKEVLDPVFLHESKEWERFTQKNKYGDYILLYVLHEKSVYEIAKKLSKDTNLKIISIQNDFFKPIEAKYLNTCGIEEFLTLIKNAKYVITDSFHGASFSIIFRKNLKVVYKKEHKDLNARLDSLINNFDIKNCRIDENSSLDDIKIMTKYNIQKIQEKIEMSKDTLSKMIGEKIENENIKK